VEVLSRQCNRILARIRGNSDVGTRPIWLIDRLPAPEGQHPAYDEHAWYRQVAEELLSDRRSPPTGRGISNSRLRQPYFYDPDMETDAIAFSCVASH
jgi:hypothetical protein